MQKYYTNEEYKMYCRYETHVVEILQNSG